MLSGKGGDFANTAPIRRSIKLRRSGDPSGAFGAALGVARFPAVARRSHFERIAFRVTGNRVGESLFYRRTGP